MAKILLRIAKRRASWDPDTTVEKVIEAEFRTRSGETDLSPSVYEVDAAHEVVVQAHAEHAAGNGLDPPRGGTNVAMGPTSMPATVTPGESKFQFTRETHRELRFADAQQLRSHVATILSELLHRSYKTTKRELLGYVKKRLEAGDQEWLDHCAAHPKWGKVP